MQAEIVQGSRRKVLLFNVRGWSGGALAPAVLSDASVDLPDLFNPIFKPEDGGWY